MTVCEQDMVPPKDPYIQVRVLDHIGDNLSLGDHSFSLTKNSVHSVRRTDAEQYISQVVCEFSSSSFSFSLSLCYKYYT